MRKLVSNFRRRKASTGTAAESQPSSAESTLAPHQTAIPACDETASDPLPLFGAKVSKQPLRKDRFRVLSVHPGRQGEEVRADLLERNIDDANGGYFHFEAVSYTWGAPSDASLPLNQEPYIRIGDRHHRITWSVRHALDVFRLAHKRRNLWIDQVCIDQTDDEEKSTQVPLMGRIYRQATGTLIWLGPHNDNMVAAAKNIKLFGDLRRQIVAAVDQNSTLFGAGPLARLNAVLELVDLSPEEHEQRGITGQRDLLSKLGSTEIEQIRDLYCNPWFVRTWPLQEVVLSKTKTAYIGHFAIEYEDLGVFPTWYIRHYYDPSPARVRGLRIVRHVHRYASAYEAGVSLSELLSKIRRFDVKEPKDKVFALLEMVNFGLGSTNYPYPGAADWRHNPLYRITPAQLRPDYSKSDAEVFLATAKYQLGRDRSVHFLTFVRHPSSPTAFLRTPSWVPWWDDPEEDNESIWLPERGNNRSADPATYVDISFDERPSPSDPKIFVQTCAVWGVEIGRVKRVSTPFHSGLRDKTAAAVKIGNEINARMKELMEAGSRSSSKPTRHLDTLVEELAMTLTMGSTTMPNGLVINIRQGEEAAVLIPRQVRGFLGWITDLRDLDPDFDDQRAVFWLQGMVRADHTVDRPFDPETTKAVMIRARLATSHRCLFRTDTGMLGLGPACTRVGDVVVILRTGPVAFVLREEEDCDSEYRSNLQGTHHLVGGCYVHGAMDGEFAENVEKEAVQFTLV